MIAGAVVVRGLRFFQFGQLVEQHALADGGGRGLIGQHHFLVGASLQHIVGQQQLLHLGVALFQDGGLAGGGRAEAGKHAKAEQQAAQRATGGGAGSGNHRQSRQIQGFCQGSD